MLAKHYEALRLNAMGAGESHLAARGRALLMRQGMAAWMRCVTALPAPVAAPAAMVNEPGMPAGIGHQLVNILATMALASLAEV